MKLAKYLADYIEHEKALDADNDNSREYDALDYETVIQQGIEAFESTWVIIVVSKETAERIRELSE